MIASLTALLSTIATHVGTVLHVLFLIAKFFMIVLLAYTFYTAMKTLLDFVGVVVTSTIIGEIFAWASMMLPFNANAVFGSITTVTSAILAFLVARKIYNMYKEMFASAS